MTQKKVEAEVKNNTAVKNKSVDGAKNTQISNQDMSKETKDTNKTTNNNSTYKDSSSVRKEIENKINTFLENIKDVVDFNKNLVSVNKLMEAGAHVGMFNYLWNPKMKPFIYYLKNSKRQIIDILKILIFLNRAYNFINEIAKQNGKILFVGTKGDIIRKLIADEAKRTNSFYVNQRWLGGTLTNYKTISSSISRLNKLIALSESEEFTKLPKHEQIKIKVEIEKKNKFIGGIKEMRGLPQAIIVTDPIVEHNAVKEARQLKIPVVALSNTNANPDLIDFIIPGNTRSIKSVWLIISILADAIAQAQNIEFKVVGKKDEEIILPETTTKKTFRQVVTIK